MKEKTVKILGLILVVSVCVASVTACGGDTDNSSTDTSAEVELIE